MTFEDEITLPEGVLAIRELRLCKVNSRDEPAKLDFYFDMPHYKGNIKVDNLPSDITWNQYDEFKS